MKCFKLFLVAAVATVCLTMGAPQLRADVGFGVSIGPEPVCPYGYYWDSPYQCAPYGYYGPEWFSNGVFIGAGPWWHGPGDWHRWHGHVDRDFDRRHFRGRFPERGEHADWDRNHFENFHGRVTVDGRGHEVRENERR